MAKNTFFFSHDSGARNDDKIIAVRMKHKAEGYAVYFMILEKLLESTDYMSIKDYNVLAFDFRVGADVVKSIVEDFGLFEFTEDGKHFYSKTFISRMDPLEKIKHRNTMKGVKGNLIRNGHLTKEEALKMSDDELLKLADSLKKSLKDSLRTPQGLAKESHKEQKNSHKIREDKIREDKNIYTSVNKEKKTENLISQIPDPSSTSPKIDLSEKEKSSAKKEKELLPFKDLLIQNGAEGDDIDEWFKLRIENRKPTTRYFVEKFIMECKKNNFSVKEAVEACAFNGWINFNYDWIVNSKQSKSKSKSSGESEPNTNDPKIGRANLSDYEKLYQQMAGN